MATKTSDVPSVQDALDEEWDTIPTGMGTSYDVEVNGPLVGNYLGSTHKDITQSDGEVRDQIVHQFAPLDDPNQVLFIWGGYELDEAMSKVQQGQKTRVIFAGRSQFKSKDGKPRQIKHYKVQTAK